MIELCFQLTIGGMQGSKMQRVLKTGIAWALMVVIYICPPCSYWWPSPWAWCECKLGGNGFLLLLGVNASWSASGQILISHEYMWQMYCNAATRFAHGSVNASEEHHRMCAKKDTSLCEAVTCTA